MLLGLLTACAAHAQDRGLMAREQRVALVVGNSAYQAGPLRNPANDADDMAAALQGLGFRVTKLKNASNREMVEAINRFGQELRKGGVGLFFFAGHGVQSRGRNFLIPIGANIGAEEQLEFESVDANRVLAAMDAAGNRVNIIILDACRDNPYARSFRSGSRGLAQMEAARGSLVAFATGPGSVASDGTGRNGLYTQHLLESLNHPDSDIDKVFRRVTADVTRSSGNKQVPWKSDSLTGEFYFKPSGSSNLAFAAPTTIVPQTDPRADDRALWESVKDSNNAAELQAYLDQFPNGIFSGVARARIKMLAALQPAPSSTSSTVPFTTPTTQVSGTLQKIRDAGIVRVGHRDAAIPFSYLDDRLQPVGYSVDICTKIIEAVKTQLRMPSLKIEFVSVTSQTRIPFLTNGNIDLECGATTNSIERQKQVAFAPTYFMTGTKIIVKKSAGIKSYDDLKGKTVVFTTGTTNERAMKAYNDAKNLGINFIPSKDHAESFLAVETGRAVAFPMDDIILYGLKASAKNPDDYVVLGEFLSEDPYAIMLRKDDTEFKKLVDSTLMNLYKSGEINSIYTKWFQSKVPPRGINLNFPMSIAMQEAIRNPNNTGVGSCGKMSC